MNKQGLIKSVLLNGTTVTIRPIRTDDSGMEQEFYTAPVERIPLLPLHASLRNCRRRSSSFFTEIDYDRHMAFVATIMRKDKELEIGVARYVHTENPVVASLE